MYNTSISCTFAKSLFLRCILALCLLSSRVELIRLKEFFPYGITAVDLSVPLNDDGSSGRVSISSSFPFFDNNYDSLFVSIPLLAFNMPDTQLYCTADCWLDVCEDVKSKRQNSEKNRYMFATSLRGNKRTKAKI